MELLFNYFKTLLLSLFTVFSMNVFSQTIDSCDDFVDGPNSNWTHVLDATTIDDGAASQAAQTFTMNVTSLPENGASFRVYKTTANGSDFFGNAVALTLGTNSITVNAVAFDRAVKFQFSSGSVEFDALSLNGQDSDCIEILPPPTSSLINDCDDFVAGPNTNWTHVLVATTVAEGAESQEAQIFTMNVTSLPTDGANVRVYKTTANGSDFFGNAVALTLGSNSITVGAVGFDRAVKFQFSSGDVEFDALNLNGEDSDCAVSVPPAYSLVSDCNDFISGPSAWPFVLVATTVADGIASQEAQTFTMNVTTLPSDGANFRVYKTTANGSDFFGNAVALTLGSNSITVNAVAFDRAVKFQFSSGSIEFDALSLNGEDSDCTSDILTISGCIDNTACNYNADANTNDNSCTYAATNADCAGDCLPGFTSVNGECVNIIYGCMYSDACNYDPYANANDFSLCDFPEPGFDCFGNCVDNCITSECGDIYYIYDFGYYVTECAGVDVLEGNNQSTNEPFVYYIINAGANNNYDISVGSSTNEVVIFVGSGNGNSVDITYTGDEPIVSQIIGSGNGASWSLIDNNVYGCMDESADNYNESANVDDGNCIYYGCMYSDACNYDPYANANDFSLCDFPEPGFDCFGNCVDNCITSECGDIYYIYDFGYYVTECAGVDVLEGNNQSTNEPFVYYIINAGANNNYDISVGSSTNEVVIFVGSGNGNSVDITYTGDEPIVSQIIGSGNGASWNLIDNNVYGCMDESADNYNESANVDDGSCTYAAPMQNLFFSEYAEGSSNNKYLEIYNASDVTVSLADYAYPNVSNAPSTVGEYEYWNSFDEGAEITPNSVYIVAHGSSDSLILALANETHNYLSNGDDGYALAYGTSDDYVVIDHIGDFNGDPGSGWDVAGVSNATKDHTLVRKCSVESGNTDWTASAGTNADDSEWIVLEQNDWSDLGMHTAECPTAVLGCTDSTADNYNELATEDDGLCEYTVLGCTDSAADNYNELATENDGSCEYTVSGLLISDCDDFVSGPNANWTHVLVATTVADGAASQEAQTFTMNVTSLPADGANVRVYKTTANGGDFFGNAVALTLGSNSITVGAVGFDRAVKFQFSSGDVAFDALSLNGEDSDCLESSPPPTSSSISDCDDFVTGPNANWTHVLVATTVADGAASQEAQTFTMNVTSLPADGANVRVYKTTASGGDFFGNAVALTLGSNSITVGAVGFDRAVKFQFSSGDVEFDALSLNGVESTCTGSVEIISGCTDTTAINYNELATEDDGTCEYPPTYSLTVSVDMSVEGFAAADGSTWDGLDGSSMAIRLDGGTWVAMTDMGDNVWSHTFADLVAGDYTYNFNDGWYESGSFGDCVGGQYGNDRLASIVDVDLTIPTVCWESCEACPDVVPGCTDTEASNYDAAATEDDGNCIYAAPMQNLFFSEYAEGSSNNKYLEIYNASDVTVSLADYAYPNVSNAPSTVGEYEYWNSFDEGAEITPNSVYIVAHGSSDSLILALANETHNYLSNGDDGYALAYGTSDDYVVIDHIGDFNGDPGSGWDVAGVSNATKDHTLVRKCSVESGNTDWTASAGTNADDSEWIVLEQNDWSDLGMHTAECPTAVLGCTDSTADNYNELATEDDGLCEYTVLGCTDSAADNYNELATENDGSCEYTVSGLLISDCDDFVSGPNANWTHVLVATTVADGAASQEAQTFTMNVTSLPADGANVRVYKTTANGGDFFGNAVALTLGSNSITVGAVGFDRAVKFQFSSGDVAFDALSLNGEDSDCLESSPPPTSSSISDCDDFVTGPNANWTHVLVATTVADGAASQEAQTFTMNVTSLPADGANVRVYKTTASGGDFFGNAVALTLGSNSITVGAVGFDRAVKFQFSSGDVEFDALSLNGVESTCTGSVEIISGCTDPTANNYNPSATFNNGSCTYCNSFEVVIISSSDASAAGTADGSVQATGDGGSNDYFVSVTDGNGVPQNSFALAAGDYTVTVTDVLSGCEASASVTISEPTVGEDPCDIVPTGLFVDDIIHNRVVFNWSAPSAAPSHYMIRYRAVGTSSWTVISAGPVNSNEFTGTSRTRYFMEPGTTYEWNIRARVLNEDGSTNCQSSWSASNEYTTLDACANLENLSVSTEAVWATLSADAPAAEWGVWQSKGKMRVVGTNSFRYVNGDEYGNISNLKGNFTPSTDYEWHTKSWCTGNVDSEGNSDPMYHSGWGDFSSFTTEAPCDKMPTNLSTSANGAQTAITMSWDTPDSGAPDHYFLELTNVTTGQVWAWNNISGSDNSKTKFGLTAGDYSWRIRGACGTNGTSWATIFSQPVTYTLGGARLENSSVANLDVYPNPSRDIFNVTFTSEEAQTMTVKVVNMIGEEIFTEELIEFVGQYTQVIDMNTQPKGVYFLEITTSTAGINKKIVLQ
jgi:hypothetical protein